MIKMDHLRTIISLVFVLICPVFTKDDFFLPLLRRAENRTDYKYSLATTQFAARVYKQIIKDSNNSNIFFSPISLYVALAMLNVGASHDSSKQIEEALGIKYLKESTEGRKLDIAVRHTIAAMNAESSSFHIANKIWMQKYFCFSRCRSYSKTITDYYYSELGQVNFARSPKNATNTINKWVSDKSNGRINRLIPSGMLKADTRFVLTNAILFQSAWKYPFIKRYTRPSQFTVFQGGKPSKKYVQTMFVQEHFYFTYGVDKSYGLLELPYKSERFSLIIILPHRAEGLAEIERTLNAPLLQKMAREVRRGPKQLTEVHLPKFRIANGLKMNDALKAIGVEDIFDPMAADLTNIIGFKGMYVSAITHKAYVNIDEYGTEASGGTGIITDDLIFDSIRVNRPFLFFIHHRPSNIVVFFGRVTDPSQ